MLPRQSSVTGRVLFSLSSPGMGVLLPTSIVSAEFCKKLRRGEAVGTRGVPHKVAVVARFLVFCRCSDMRVSPLLIVRMKCTRLSLSPSPALGRTISSKTASIETPTDVPLDNSRRDGSVIIQTGHFNNTRPSLSRNLRFILFYFITWGVGYRI